MTDNNKNCPVCGAMECNHLIAKVPLGIAMTPVDNGKPKSGRFHTTTERVWRNGHLVVGSGQTIPWEQAMALGLVPDEKPITPLAQVKTPTDPDELPQVIIDDKNDPAPELVAAKEQTAAVRRRAGKKASSRTRKAAPRKVDPE